MNVAFINENTLGHASYLLPLVRALGTRPELGILPHLINATPLPARLERWANSSMRGLRRWGLDFHNARWRLTASRHARNEVQALRSRVPVESIVVNTQSVALGLTDIALEIPVLVCLDATFELLARSRWFAPNAPSRWLLPLTIAPLRARERTLFERAQCLLPWSELARQSLLQDYQLPERKVVLLPPSVALPPRRSSITARPKIRPQILFVGGDFRRKGGPLLLECYRKHFASRCDLHIVTQADVAPEPGVCVHKGLAAESAAWKERWEQADVFVFPSTLETFGIVLLEALAFEVPVISAEVGAAREILAGGQAGWLLSPCTVESLRESIEAVICNPGLARGRTEFGRRKVEEEFNLGSHVARLAECLHKAKSME